MLAQAGIWIVSSIPPRKNLARAETLKAGCSCLVQRVHEQDHLLFLSSGTLTSRNLDSTLLTTCEACQFCWRSADHPSDSGAPTNIYSEAKNGRDSRTFCTQSHGHDSAHRRLDHHRDEQGLPSRDPVPERTWHSRADYLHIDPHPSLGRICTILRPLNCVGQR